MAKMTKKTPQIKRTEPDAAKRPNQKVWFGLAVFTIILSIWIGYHNTLNHSFHFDDTHAIVNNKQITELGDFRDLHYWMDINNRPLSYFSFALNYKTGKLEPKPYHMINILIHILSAILLFMVIYMVFTTTVMGRSRLKKYVIPLAALAAMIFALHPVQTQSVTYIIQRMESMAWMFSLASLLSYLHGRILHSQGKRLITFMPFYLLAFLTWIAALLSKQTAAALPLVCLAAEFFFITGKDGKPYKRYLVIATLLAAVLAVFVVATDLIPPEKGSLPKLAYLATQMKVIVKYMQISILPVHLTLDYAFVKSSSLLEPVVLISSLVHLVMIAIAFSLRKRNPLAGFGILLFYLPLAITSTVFPIRDVIFEHRIYLSLAGFGLILSSLFFSFMVLRPKRIWYLIPAVYLLTLGIAAFERNKVWQDNCTLWKDTLEKEPGSSRAWLAVGDCYKQQNNFVQALKHYNQALLLDSTNATALNNRGNLKLTQNDLEGAIADYNTIIRISPEFRNLAYLNMGIAYTKKGEPLKAVQEYTKAINAGNAETRVYFHRALSYVYLGDYPHAESDLNVVLEKNPVDKDALFNMASVMMNTDRYGEAATYYTRLLSFAPDHLASMHYRGLAYYALGKRSEACSDWQKSAESNYQPSVDLLNKYCRHYTL